MSAEHFDCDEALISQASALLDRLGAIAAEPGDIATACHGDSEFDALPPHVQGELTTLLGYELDDGSGDEGVRLTPKSARDGWWAVRPYQETPVAVRDFWRALSGRVSESLVLAQLDDLVLSSGTDTGAAHATSTVQRYLEVATRHETDSFHSAMVILRAAAVARRRRMVEEREVWLAGAGLLDRLLKMETAPGGPARLVGLLAARPIGFAMTVENRATLSRLLDAAEEKYSHADAADWIADARRRLSQSTEERLVASARQVDRYLVAAENSEGFARMHLASRAAELAKDHGVRDGHEAAVRIMQSTRPDAMGWQKVDISVPVPTAAVRSYIRRVARADGWRQALSGFLASSSPSGSFERNRKTAAEVGKGSIRSLFSTTVFGSHGLPERTGADFDENELLRTEQFAVGTYGLLLNEQLHEIRRRFGMVPVQDVRDLLVERYGCDGELALQFGTALDLFWAGRQSDAARLLIPLIEAGARGLLLKLDEAIYRVERGRSPGRFPAMDFYVDRLADLDLDPDWERAVRVVLLSPGMNLRNMSAHGFKFVFTASETAVLVRLAGLFCTLPNSLNQAEGHEELREPLKSPRRVLRRRLGWVWK